MSPGGSTGRLGRCGAQGPDPVSDQARPVSLRRRLRFCDSAGVAQLGRCCVWSPDAIVSYRARPAGLSQGCCFRTVGAVQGGGQVSAHSVVEVAFEVEDPPKFGREAIGKDCGGKPGKRAERLVRKGSRGGVVFVAARHRWEF